MALIKRHLLLKLSLPRHAKISSTHTTYMPNTTLLEG